MNLINWPLLLTAVLLGTGLGLQAPINAWIGRRLGSRYWGASFSIGISVVVILAFTLLVIRSIPDPRIGWAAPWWVGLGGIFGAIFVAGAVILVPRLGVALFFTCVVSGQMLISLLVDRFGWFELPMRSLTLERILGVVLVIAGMLLIQRGSEGGEVP